MRKSIYIAAPYKKNPEKFTFLADYVGKILTKAGYIPFIPHKMFYGWEKDKKIKEKTILEIDFYWLERCDIVLFLPEWETSNGCQKEMRLAKKLRKEICLDVYDLLGE